MATINKTNLWLLCVVGALLFGVMWLTPPTTGPVVIFIWFGLIGLVVYLGQKLVYDLFSLRWSRLRGGVISVAALALIGLSTLGQLTVLDILGVAILAGLTLIAHRLRFRRK